MKDQRRTSVVRARPRVADVQIHAFGRSLHPELVESCESRSFERGKYRAQIDILRSGHVVRWTYDEAVVLSEVVCSSSCSLPNGRRLLQSAVQGRKDHAIDGRRGICYRVSTQLEKVDPQLLYLYQDELSHEGRKGMLCVFGSSGRAILGGLSYIYAETRTRSFRVQTLHTFPDDCCLLKVESVFSAPQ